MAGEISARHAFSKELIEGVNERTGGVPLFVEEVTRLLVERGEAPFLFRMTRAGRSGESPIGCRNIESVASLTEEQAGLSLAAAGISQENGGCHEHCGTG